MAQPIEAKLRITGDGAQAISTLRAVKKEKDALTQSAAGGKTAFGDISAGAADAAVKTKTARGEVDALRAAERASRDEARAAAAARKAEDKAAAEARRAAAKAEQDAAREASRAIRQARNEARQLGPQLTDITVGLATGQSPFMVLLQQGGQLRDIFGGVGNAAKALAAVFTPLRIVVGGVAAVIATLGFQSLQGALESDALRKSLALTGNLAGTSAGQLDAMAKQIATSQKASIGAVRETLAAVVETGAFTGASIDAAGRAATALSKLSGKSAADTVKDFAEMGNGVAAWAAKSNLAYNFLTADQYKYIRSLEAQGRTQEAMRVTLDALASTMEQRSQPALGLLERTWNAVGAAVSRVLDDLKAIGRDTTAEEKIAALQKKIEQARLNRGIPVTGSGQPAVGAAGIAALEAELELRQRDLTTMRRLEGNKAAALRENQAEVVAAQKAHQDALAQVNAAGAQKLLAQQLAAADVRQAAADRAFAAGETSELAHNVALNKIDQQRLAAQEATLKRQLEIEKGKRDSTGTPDERLANDAAVTAIEGQLIEVRGRIAQEVAKGRSLVEADALARAQDNAQQWAAAWTQAFQQVRQFAQQNAATRALGIGDSDARAAAEAAAKTAAVRQQLADLQRDLALRLSLTIDPAQQAELRRQIDDLAAESQQALDEQTRAARFASFQAQLGELQAELSLREQQIALAQERGALTTEEAEQRKFAARAQSLPQLDAILAKMREIASTPAERSTTERSAVEVEKTRIELTQLELTARGAAKGAFAQLFTDITTGAKTGKAALEDMVGGFAKAMLNVLNQQLAEQLIKQFTDAVPGGGAGGSGIVDGLLNLIGFFPSFHSGGVVGAGGGAARAVPAAAWAFAPRYHGGGIVGLRPRERAILAEDGEEMLTEDDPRHIRNFRGAGVSVALGVTVNAGSGNERDLLSFGNDLAAAVRPIVLDVVVRESRVGGLLAGRR